MNSEPLLDEIRRVRHEISSEVDHDPRKIVAYYANLQHSVIGRIVNLSGEVAAEQNETVRVADQPAH